MNTGAGLSIFDQNSGSLTTTSNNELIGDAAGRYYTGLGSWTPGSSVRIMQISLTLTGIGTISGKTYVCEIWTMTGGNLNAKLYSSAGVAGVDAWADAVVPFSFSGVTANVTSATPYAITATVNGSDGSNAARLRCTAPGGISGNLMNWDVSGVQQNSDTNDPKVIIYT